MSTGIGAEEIEKEHTEKPDFNRGAGGEPLIQMPDGKQERYARQSSLGDTLDEKSGLNNWLVAKAVEGAAKDQSILARAIASSPYEDHKSDWTDIRQDAIQAGRGAYKADIGTAVHAMSERWELEPNYDPGEPFRKGLEAYTKCMTALGLKSQMIECQFVNDAFRTAGTADRLYELTIPLLTPTDEVLLPGTLIIGDLKTGSSLEYSIPGYSIQLAGYAGGSLYNVETNVRMPTPTINQKWAIIMHLDVEGGHCEFLWVDLEIGRFGAHMANEVREWRRNWRRKAGYKATLLPVKTAPDDFIEIISEDPDPEIETPASEVVEDLNPRPDIEDLDAWIAYARRRLDVIKANTEIKEWMMVRWASDLLPPKRIETIEQAQDLSKFLDRVEAHFGMTFTEGQPVAPAERRAS